MDCIVVKIVVDDALSYSIIFIGIFNYWFLEICVKLKHL